MTGYGRGEASRDGYKVTVEVSSVNRKQSEVYLSLPRELEPLEARIRETIHQRVARGRLSAKIQLETKGSAWRGRVRFNEPLARAYAAEFTKLSRSLHLSGGITLESLLRLPGVVATDEPEAGLKILWPLVEAALTQALARLLKTREKEGSHLAHDLKTRIHTLRRLVGQIRRRAPRVSRDYHANLLDRIRAAGLEGVRADDDRVIKEVVFFADRADITEELTRLDSHFVQFDDCVESTEAVGRMLDFLAQEMGREINTIGSKANDATISRAVVALKAELERFREQVQNVE
ncbi:MAG: YicC family protein [Verrucomicrobiales bacterium]|nr:YicC family protein [Verrucomicrobiales bacterium]